MRLVHYSDAPVRLADLRIIDQVRERGVPDQRKPRGFWVSDDDCEDNWRAWCEGEGFSLDRLKCVHDVELKPGANVLVLCDATGIDEFTRKWALHPHPGITSNMFMDWTGVREQYQGMIITPYIWERRLSYGENDAMWYYGWDCASGCIWDPAAIASIQLRES